jgi:hypothetical protein
VTGTDCVRCARPTPDGFACVTCRDRILCDLLGDDSRDDRPGLVDTAPAARDIAQGQASGHGEGGASGKPESRLPLDLAVTAKLDAVQGEMTTWARHVAEERYSGPQGRVGEDPIVVAARYLAANVEWLRHRPSVDEAYAAIEACARVVRGIVRGPAAQRFLGPCGAERKHEDGCSPPLCGDGYDELVGVVECDCWCHRAETATCEGDVYARDGGSTGRCRTCGAEVSTAERQAWLDAEVRSRAFTAKDIADAYGINVKTIRSWGTERQARYDHSGTLVQAPRAAKLREHGRDRDGRSLFLVGDVLDLAAGDAARRETARNERERRKTAQAEGAAA